MKAVAAQSNPRAEMQPLYLALLGRVNEAVRGNVAAALASPRGVAASFLAYVALWRLLRAALTPEGAEVKPGQPATVLEVLLGWFAPSPELLAELRAAENMAMRPLFPMRTGMRSGGLQLRSEDLPALPPTDRELCEQATRLGLPALAGYLGSPSHATHLVRLYAVLLQAEWQHSDIALNVNWPQLPEPFALDGPRLLLELLDEREPTGRMRRPGVAAAPAPIAAGKTLAPQRLTAPASLPAAAASTAILSVAPSPSRPVAVSAVAANAQHASGPVPRARSQSGRAPAEDVRFTVYRPRTLKPEQWSPLLAFAHRSEKAPSTAPNAPEPLDGVDAQAQAILGSETASDRQSGEDSARAVPFESRLNFVADVPGVEFDPPLASCRFTRDVHRAEFRMRAPASMAGQMARGRLRVQFGSIVLAEIALTMKVAAPSGMEHAGIVSDSARMYRRIFASYSHQDWAIAEQFNELAQALGDRYMIDMNALRAGERWSAALQKSIAEADVFQLFWSWNALHSPFVRQEWEYALSLGRPNFLRPSYWEHPLPEPPAELRGLHFHSLRPLPALPTANDAAAAPPATGASESRNSALSMLLTFGGVAASALLALQLVLAPGDPAQPSSQPTAASEPSQSVPISTASQKLVGQPVQIQSLPSGAEVYLRGTRLGVTPMQLTPSATAALEGLELRSPGYASKPIDLREARDQVLTVELTPDPHAIALELQRLRKELTAAGRRFGDNDTHVRELRARIEALKRLRPAGAAESVRTP